MSTRQTQPVSPMERKPDRSTAAQTNVVYESEAEPSSPSRSIPHTTATTTVSNNDDKSLISFLKTILENQFTKPVSMYSPFDRIHGPASYGHHCQCQMHSNDCHNQSQNQLAEPLQAFDSSANNDESSIKSLLLTVLKNQVQQNSGPTQCAWSQSPTHCRQSTVPVCQMHLNHCQHQLPNQQVGHVPISTTPKTNNEDPPIRSLLMTILKNQTRMAHQIENLIKSQEEIMKRLDPVPTNILPAPTRISFKKIDTVKECHEFEENLKNVEYSQSMFKHFESVCGGNSDLYGDNVGYALIDHIFTRRLFTLVTWTGLSRGTELKESFQKFERIFQFFFDLIRRVDSEYSIKSLKDFFQKIISNSKRRFEYKRSRMSRVKHCSFKRKKNVLPGIETNNCEGRNSNVDGEQETLSDENTDNEEDYKDTVSIYSYECNTDELTTNQDLKIIKAEEESD